MEHLFKLLKDVRYFVRLRRCCEGLVVNLLTTKWKRLLVEIGKFFISREKEITIGRPSFNYKNNL